MNRNAMRVGRKACELAERLGRLHMAIAQQPTAVGSDKLSLSRNDACAILDAAIARALEQPAKQPLERCPECYRPKARDANDCAAGCCAKWYAVRDGEASAECEKLAAFWKRPEGREVVAWEIISDSGKIVEITNSIKRRDDLLYRGSTNNLPEWKSRPLVYGDATPPANSGTHCATCACNPGMTKAIRFDVSPAEAEGAVRAKLIEMGWTPPPEKGA